MSDIETGIGIGRQLQAIESRVMMQEKMMESMGKDIEDLAALLKEKGILVDK